MAERAPAEKDALSHRGRAAALVAAALRSETQP
jgi:inosine/xanthosine triphosphate pyrophosphatase family protein